MKIYRLGDGSVANRDQEVFKAACRIPYGVPTSGATSVLGFTLVIAWSDLAGDLARYRTGYELGPAGSPWRRRAKERESPVEKSRLAGGLSCDQ